MKYSCNSKKDLSVYTCKNHVCFYPFHIIDLVPCIQQLSHSGQGGFGGESSIGPTEGEQ